MSKWILFSAIILLAFSGFLLIACGDENEDSSDANDNGDDDDDDDDNGENNDDDIDDDNLNDDSDDDTDMQVESSFEYLEGDFTDPIDLDPNTGPDCSSGGTPCDTPLGLLWCDIQDEMMWMWGGCSCGYNDCCNCIPWTR